ADLTTFPSGGAMLDVRRQGRAFVMAYTPGTGFGVDEIHADDGFLPGYRFVFEHFESAAEQLRSLVMSKAGSAAFCLFVLQSGDLEAPRSFSRLLGLSFVAEQHGKGPQHYAATTGPVVLEIYPCQPERRPTPVRLGFQVPSVDSTVEALRQRGVKILREAT